MYFFSAVRRHDIVYCLVNSIAFLLYMQSCSRDVNGTLKAEHGTKGRCYVIALFAFMITDSTIFGWHFSDLHTACQ